MRTFKSAFLVFSLAICTQLVGQNYTQRLLPDVVSDVNDVCPNDEVVLTLDYTEPTNTSLSLNGINEHVNIPDNPALNFGTATNFTIEFYIKTSSLSPLQVILAKGGTASAGYAIGMSAGVIVATISDGTNTIPVNGFLNVADGSWHHVAVVFERASKATIYTDGFFDNDGNINTVANIDNTVNISVGAADIGGTFSGYFNGYIDELRIWSVARTVAEITASKQFQINPNSVNNLVGYWDMNDAAPPTLVDCSPSGASGQMVGSASLNADAPVLIWQFLPRWSNGQTGKTIFANPLDTMMFTAEVGYCKYLSIDSLRINVIECEDIDETGLVTSVWVPSAFTPNGDTKNDLFEVQASYITYYEIMIFNRFGNLLYHSKNILNSWDGTYEGGLVKDDVYRYLITYRNLKGEEFKKQGCFTVLE